MRDSSVWAVRRLVLSLASMPLVRGSAASENKVMCTAMCTWAAVILRDHSLAKTFQVHAMNTLFSCGPRFLDGQYWRSKDSHL